MFTHFVTTKPASTRLLFLALIGVWVMMAGSASARDHNPPIESSTESSRCADGPVDTTGLDPMTFNDALAAGDSLLPPFEIAVNATMPSAGAQTKSVLTSQQTAPRGGVLENPTASLDFTCNGFACTCSGDTDCNDMFSTNVCGAFAICFEDARGTWCLCQR